MNQTTTPATFPTSTRILLVDDSSTYREFLRLSFSQLGYRSVDTAKDGKDAYSFLTSARRQGLDFQLIVSDLHMPEINGLELLRLVRKTSTLKDVPFLLITTEADKPLILEAVKHGVSGYLIKPFEPLNLERKLQSIYERRLSSKLALLSVKPKTE